MDDRNYAAVGRLWMMYDEAQYELAHARAELLLASERAERALAVAREVAAAAGVPLPEEATPE